MANQCKYCGEELDTLVPFRCKRCGNYYCKEHRLPENHSCVGVREDWDVWKKVQKKMQGIPEEKPVSHTTIKNHPSESSHKQARKETERERKHKPYGSSRRKKKRYGLLETIRYKLGRARFPLWILAIVIIWIIIGIIHQFYIVKLGGFDLSIFFYIFEIIIVGYIMFLLLKRLDRIHVGSDMRLFGLRMLSGLVSFIGFLVFVFMMMAPFYAIFDENIASVILFGSTFNLPMTGMFFFSVVGFGLMIAGAYLYFKFQRRTGDFVWFGRAR